jgi:hypothetical protein
MGNYEPFHTDPAEMSEEEEGEKGTRSSFTATRDLIFTRPFHSIPVLHFSFSFSCSQIVVGAIKVLYAPCFTQGKIIPLKGTTTLWVITCHSTKSKRNLIFVIAKSVL